MTGDAAEDVAAGVCEFLALCLSCGFEEIVWGRLECLQAGERGEGTEKTKLANPPPQEEGRQLDEEEKAEMSTYYFLSFLLQPRVVRAGIWVEGIPRPVLGLNCIFYREHNSSTQSNKTYAQTNKQVPTTSKQKNKHKKSIHKHRRAKQTNRNRYRFLDWR